MADSIDKQIEKLAQMVKRGFDEVRGEMATGFAEVRSDIADLRSELKTDIAEVNRRIDQVIRPELDEHAHRIKKLEETVGSN